MKVVYDWLQDYVDLDEAPELLAERLTAAGLEVEHFGPPAQLQDPHLLLGSVRQLRPCPGRARLWLAEVSIGQQAASSSRRLSIVCGAPALKPGRRVIVAAAGARLRSFAGEQLQVSPQRFGTQMSEGMLCSPYDLGLGPQRNELLYPESDLPDGTAAAAALTGKESCVFEIGLTPNRGDAASHYGVARELSVLLGRPLRYPEGLPLPRATAAETAACLAVDDLQACPRYCGLRLSGVRVSSSPSWLQRRLRAAGLLPINNVVDITNYVAQAVGQPLHAFDWKKVSGGRIYVQAATEAAVFKTLDGKEQQVAPGDLLICDEAGPLALAGIMGGARSAVSEQTTTLFLESAYFSASTIARTARRLDLQTEAAFRYARGIDPERPYAALCWAALLLQQCTGACPEQAYDFYPKPLPRPKVWCRWPRFRQLTGCVVPRNQLQRILKALDIEVLHKERSRWQLCLPLYRSDVQREVDVFEEILRIYGYDCLQGEMKLHYSPCCRLPQQPVAAEHAACGQLIAEGFFEIITNPLLAMGTARCADPPQRWARLAADPASEQQRYLRPSLLPSGLEVMTYNLRHKQTHLRFFELGSAYWRNKDGSYAEEQRLALYLCGTCSEQPWLDDSPLRFYDLSAVVNRLFSRLGLDLHSAPAENPYFGNALGWYRGQQQLAIAGQLLPDYFPTPAYAAELRWSLICEHLSSLPPLRYRAVPRTPEVHRDISLILDKVCPYAAVQQVIECFSGQWLQQVRLRSVYTGEPLPPDKKSYAISFVLQADRTLSEHEISTTMQKLQRTFEKKLGAQIRTGT